LVKRLNSKWAPMFTLNMIQSPKRAEFDGYVSRVLADVSSVNAQEVTLQFELEYASINKHFQMSMQTALTRDDMVRSVETLHNLVTDTVIHIGSKPDFSDEQTRDLAAVGPHKFPKTTKVHTSPYCIRYRSDR
jgi:hypothetical protein